jgi:hypothetical protein
MYFYKNQEKFCVHSGTMDKKFFTDNNKNTQCPKGVNKIFLLTLNCSEIFPILTYFTFGTICLVIKNFIVTLRLADSCPQNLGVFR